MMKIMGILGEVSSVYCEKCINIKYQYVVVSQLIFYVLDGWMWARQIEFDTFHSQFDFIVFGNC